MKHENHQKLIILEGFSKNGLQIEFSGLFYILQHGATLIFDIFCKSMFFLLIICVVNRVFEKGFGDLSLI